MFKIEKNKQKIKKMTSEEARAISGIQNVILYSDLPAKLANQLLSVLNKRIAESGDPTLPGSYVYMLNEGAKNEN